MSLLGREPILRVLWAYRISRRREKRYLKLKIPPGIDTAILRMKMRER